MNSDWQCQYTEISKRGSYLLQNEKWSDCRFLVGIEPNQRLISGHKLILAMASPVFECMFYGQMADKTDPILIPDVQPDAFTAMMEYIYSDQININNFDAACELCYVAKKYMLPHVVDFCTHFLWSDINPSNACRAYEFAKLFDETRLIQKSMALMVAFTREVINDPSFIDIEISTLMDILNQDKLNIESELDLFNAINRLSNARGINHKENNDTNNYSTDISNNEASNTKEISLITAEPEKLTNIIPNNEIDDNQKNENTINIMENNSKVSLEDNSDEILKKVPSTTNNLNETSTSSNTNLLENNNNKNKTDNNNTFFKPTTSLTIQNVQDSSTVNDLANEISRRPPIHENIIREAVKKIRFLTMTPQQFAEGPALSNLLQQKEALAIFIRISSSHNADYPMPEGFTTSRVFRNFFDSQRLDHRLQRHELLNNIRHTNNGSNNINNGNLSQLGLPLTDVLHTPTNTSGSLTGRINHCIPSASHPIYTDVHGNRLNILTPPDPEEIRRRFGIRTYDPPFDFHPTTQSDRRHLRSPSNNNNHILLRIL